MSLENFKNRKLEWDTVNKNFDQSVQVISGDVNSRTVTIVITDKGEPIDLTGYSVKLVYKYIYNDISGFVMLTPTDAPNGEFSLIIPTEMTSPGSIKSNLILLNENLEQVIVSKNLKFISDDSTVTDLAQEVNNKIDDFTKLLLESMPQVMRSELNDLHAQTESNTSNIELKANSSDMTNLQSAMNSLQNKVEAFGITPENLVTIKSLLDAIANNATDSEVAELINSVNVLTSNISLMSDGDYSPKANKTDLESLQHTVNNQSATISTKANKTDLDNLKTTVTGQGVAISTKAEQADLLITSQNVTTAQTTANQAETDAQTAIAKATEAQSNSLPLSGNAVSASKLATPRKLGVSLQASAYQNFDGTADVTNVGVSGVLPIANGGTGTSDGVINTIAYANSANGTDGFTTVYPNLNLLNFNSGITFGKHYGWAADITSWSGYRAYFKKVKVTPNNQYTISANWSNTLWLNVYAFTNESDTTAVARYGSDSGLGAGSWDSKFIGTRKVSNNMTFTIPANVNYLGVSYASISTDTLTLQALLNGKPKLEQGSIATPWIPSASEVTTTDYPKYVGFSNVIKPNKTTSDYKWLPMVNFEVSGALPVVNGGTGTNDGVINTIAYANSADGADGFTTVYPNLNLLKNTKSQSYTSTGTAENISSNKYPLDVVRADILNKPFTITYNYAITNSSGIWSGTIRPTYGLGGANQSVSNTNLSGTHKETITSTGIGFDSYGIVTSGLPAGTTVTITNLKVEFGSIATPWMPSSSEVTTADYPKYVGFSNVIKPNKTSSDYKWLPMGLVSIDSATGLLKPSVMGIDYAQAHPVGSVISNSSNSSSGYTTGTWQNIGSAVIGSTTIYYWKRTV